MACCSTHSHRDRMRTAGGSLRLSTIIQKIEGEPRGYAPHSSEGVTPTVGQASVKPLAVAAGLASLALFAYLAQRVWPFTVDDSFITLRYARNLAAGYGPTFNPGEPP